MENPDAIAPAASPDVPTRTIMLTSTDERGLQWAANTDGVSRMELPTILRLCANLIEKGLTGG